MGAHDADLELLFALADAADAVSSADFRLSELRTITKVDGTPVSEVDLATEQAVHALLRSERPDDAVIGEEIGEHAGTSGRRWIVDGIDGTHNYAAGYTGWGTILGLEIDGESQLAMVTAPLLGWRWWAVAGEGAWRAPFDGGRFDRTTTERIHCSTTAVLADATVHVMPPEGVMSGWRNEIGKMFVSPPEPRSHCLALNAVMVATGELDVALQILGGLWDFAPPRLIVREAGGEFRDMYGGERLDTATGVFCNPALLPQVFDAIGKFTPDVPDEPVLARFVSKPIGGDDEGHTGELDEWRRFGRSLMPTMSARHLVEHAPPLVFEVVDERAAHLAVPFSGVTTDGHAIPGLRSLDGVKVSTEPITDAALAFLDALTPDQRAQATFEMNSIEWRKWINVHMNHFRHGVMLEDLAQPVRDLALGILRATLSARGYDQARTVMRINELIAQLTGDYVAFGEWPYFMSIFGDPNDGPWGWQIDGHHLCINTVVLDGRIVTTPTFMGAEPRRVHQGVLAGVSLFDPEELLGLDLIRAFDRRQRDKAIIYPSLHPDEIPTPLQNIFDGRMQGGAFHDNIVLPYQGVPGRDMTDAQRRVLSDLAATYVGWNGEGHAEVRMREVAAHLDDTWFSWYGGTDDTAPFYYRVHSPVILIEFDHHPGVVFDNINPTRHHVHTLVRTPNGGDYGTDLIAQHHARFDHSNGHHRARH